MSVLLMRLQAPLQSWGSRSRFSQRTTESHPTKSGVIGMIAAAKGVARTDSLEQFDGLRFAVRTDQPGLLLTDFQTAHDDNGKSMPLSNRQYLADAVFLTGLEDSSPNGRDRLEDYVAALRAPYFPLYLGRRSCPPDGPVKAWVVDDSLEDAMHNTPWQATERYQNRALRSAARFPERMAAEIFMEATGTDVRSSDAFSLNDSPRSYDPRRREWTQRTEVRLGTTRPEPTVQVNPKPRPAASSVGRRQYTDSDFPADSHNPMSAIMQIPAETDGTQHEEQEGDQ